MLKKFEHSFVVFAGWLLVFLMGLVILQVVMRYLVHRPLSWSEELARVVYMSITVLGVILACGRGKIIAVQALRGLFGKTMNKILAFAELVLVVGLNLVFTYSGIEYVLEMQSSGHTTPILAIPVWIVYLLFPVMGASVVAISCYKFYRSALRGSSVNN